MLNVVFAIVFATLTTLLSTFFHNVVIFNFVPFGLIISVLLLISVGLIIKRLLGKISLIIYYITTIVITIIISGQGMFGGDIIVMNNNIGTIYVLLVPIAQAIAFFLLKNKK